MNDAWFLMPECGVQVSPGRTPLSLPTLITSSVKKNGMVLGQLALASIQSEQPAGGRLELTRASGVSMGLRWMTSVGAFLQNLSLPGGIFENKSFPFGLTEGQGLYPVLGYSGDCSNKKTNVQWS